MSKQVTNTVALLALFDQEKAQLSAIRITEQPRLLTKSKINPPSYKFSNRVNNKMLEHDWLLTAPIYGLIGCFKSKLSDLTCPITNICNRTGQIGQLSSQ